MPKRGRATTPKRTTRRKGTKKRVTRKGAARPMRSLKQSYRGNPNQYRFVRETVPVTVNLSDNDDSNVNLIAGTGTHPNVSRLHVESFKMADLASFSEDFATLFVNFKIDKIETILVPMWTQSVQEPFGPAGGAAVVHPDLMCTRINTKFYTAGTAAPATAEGARLELAQLQMKSRSIYGSKKWLKLITKDPMVRTKLYDENGTEEGLKLKKAGWLGIGQHVNTTYQTNDVCFFDRLDGTDFIADEKYYMYRMYHRVHFRVSLVG
jgi:hypothetical protein